MPDAPFASQVAIVTGGARGIGHAVAAALASQGAKACLVDLSAEALQAGKAKLEQEVPGAQVMTHACDVSDPAAGAAAADGGYWFLLGVGVLRSLDPLWQRVERVRESRGDPTAPRALLFDK